MTYISEFLAGAIDTGLRGAGPSQRHRSDAPSLDMLAARLAGTISGIDPALRLVIAQRVITYARDLLVRPVSPAGGQVLDQTVERLRWLTPGDLTAPAND